MADEIKITKTGRNFDIGRFSDYYGSKCSIQKSSLALIDCIWLGIEDPEPKIMEPGIGWIPFEIPEGVLVKTHMHLTQEQVKELLPILQKFAETGELQ